MLAYNKMHLFGIELFFNEFRSYMSFMEEYLERSGNEFKKNNTLQNVEKFKDTDSDYYNHLIDTYAERWFEISLYYPHNFRASFLVQIFSVIEYELRKICDHYHRVKKTNFALKDLKGNSDLEGAALFLKKACKVDFTDLQDDWNKINLFRKIRNRIVHHQGKITKQDKDWNAVKTYIDKNNDKIAFKENPDEIDDDGQLHYLKRPKFGFTILLRNKMVNEEFLITAEHFFNNLLNKHLKYV